jgi:hypothetical protein
LKTPCGARTLACCIDNRVDVRPSRSLWALGRQHQDWSADYKLHSRASWQAQDLFQPILQRAACYCDDSLLVIAMDDTRIRKTGHKILTAFYQRDPQSPKFRFNLMWGLRFLHFSLLTPLYRSNPAVPPRSLPVRFLEVPALKKPGKKASAEQIQAHIQAVKQHNLSRRTTVLLEDLRRSADTAGLDARTTPRRVSAQHARVRVPRRLHGLWWASRPMETPLRSRFGKESDPNAPR